MRVTVGIYIISAMSCTVLKHMFETKPSSDLSGGLQVVLQDSTRPQRVRGMLTNPYRHRIAQEICHQTPNSSMMSHCIIFTNCSYMEPTDPAVWVSMLSAARLRACPILILTAVRSALWLLSQIHKTRAFTQRH